MITILIIMIIMMMLVVLYPVAQLPLTMHRLRLPVHIEVIEQELGIGRGAQAQRDVGALQPDSQIDSHGT